MNQVNSAQQLTADDNQLTKHAVNVHKFGGSSLANSQCIERVLDIIRTNCQINDMVVVSACGDTTNELFSLYQKAQQMCSSNENTPLEDAVQNLKESQEQLITALLSNVRAKKLLQSLNNDIEQLTHWLSKDITEHQSDILAFGELWSARLLSAVLNERVCPSYAIDARDFLVIDNCNNYFVEQDISKAQFNACHQRGKLAVITGYITKDSTGKSCTLGRNGSDYSATIIASLICAVNVTLWTDVDGIYSADPREVPSARKLHRLPSGVAKELGRLGNPVLHYKTLEPLVNDRREHVTHLHVASSFDPSISGTEIGKFGQIAKQELSVTYLNDLLIATSTCFLEDDIDLADQGISLLCQDKTKGFIVFPQAYQANVVQWVKQQGEVVSFSPASIVATVGHKITKHGNIKAKFKRALGQAKPEHLISSENGHSLIAVLAQPCTSELLNNIHHDMTKDTRHIGLVVAGIGNIGQRFLSLLPQQIERVSALENLHLVGLIGSKNALINTDGIDVNQAVSLYQSSAERYDNDLLLSWLANHPYDELIIVDITPSESFSLMYEQFFEQGIHVIGANKWAASSNTAQYQKLLSTAEKNQSLWLGNTTVGAGLPINHVINDLRSSGDVIIELSGIFSGTLSWLFETFDGSEPFSTLLLSALEQGITEPDPREDLSGRDVQRKLLILARMAGFTLSLEDIECQNLVPNILQDISKEAFLSRANEVDDYFAQMLAKAQQSNDCIRYIAKFSAKDDKLKAQVYLATLANTDAFANLTPGDNIFKVISHWYQDNPLIIRGPGAGRDVTAGGIHSDLVNICQQLASKQNQVKIKGIN